MGTWSIGMRSPPARTGYLYRSCAVDADGRRHRVRAVRLAVRRKRQLLELARNANVVDMTAAWAVAASGCARVARMHRKLARCETLASHVAVQVAGNIVGTVAAGSNSDLE